jgi:protein-glucosylgalactosylhydroxylysine glucosidase
MPTRRRFLKAAAGWPLLPLVASAAPAPPIDRRAVVARHDPELRDFDPRSPLSVGNGEFAFTVDATGLQTFPELYDKAMPLCTQSQWGWHSNPGPPPGVLALEEFDTHGRKVGYATRGGDNRELYNWLRENPHRLHLGRIGLDIADRNEISQIRQKLDLWSGTIESSFLWRGSPVTVRTCCHPDMDVLAVCVSGGVGVGIEFPGASPEMNAADWKSPERHHTEIVSQKPGRCALTRRLDGDSYFVRVAWASPAEFRQAGPHRFLLRATGKSLDFTVGFSPRPSNATDAADPAPEKVFAASRDGWQRFWTSGGAMDLSECRDPRAKELERRVVLSQYLTAIQCAGSLPPQETGLTCNSWYGKFHLEMHWWHAAHFPLWGRAAKLERSLGWYNAILPSARERAKQQGYAGCRWPKMTAPDGRDSPSPIGPLLIWEQPHPIAMAELVYQAQPNRATLLRYRDMVLESAEFMASYAWLDASRNRYVLGPPVIPAQENHPPRDTWNPTFELEYWRRGLEMANRWRERLGLPRDPRWDEVRKRMSALPIGGGVYLAHENCPQTFTERNRDHPSMLAALGVLPAEGSRVDPGVMRATLRKVFEEWRWEDTWGWDFPVAAMTAARLGEPALAIRALFTESPKNTWLPNGHVWQRANLPLYLPANGGLLAAMAVMSATHAFPKDWPVRAEGLRDIEGH